MRCPACDVDLPENARFCPACGQEAVPEMPSGPPLTVEGGEAGAWRWILVLLLGVERLVAWWAFPLDDPGRVVAAWEPSFFWIYGAGGLLLGGPLLAFRVRAGGWVAGLSGIALLVRSCLPLLGEKPADGAIWALMVASATLTFAFFHEQSWWGRSPSAQESLK
ncbi:MAG TPA: zinc ribbon domain-containing protein [Holophagaceae bacterium]|nr:zinc ribbon domain-containing protein [Holophagaceae bacterium]